MLTVMNMENVHLAPEGDSDDLYSGYDYNDPMIDVSYSWAREIQLLSVWRRFTPCERTTRPSIKS